MLYYTSEEEKVLKKGKKLSTKKATLGKSDLIRRQEEEIRMIDLDILNKFKTE